MSLIDRYLSRMFLYTLAFALVAFVLVFIIVDLIENLDKYIDHDASFRDVLYYYLCYIPFILVLTLPVAMLLSTLFSLGTLSKYNELTAIKANGVSLYRILLPIFAIAFLVSLVVLFSAEFLVPYANAEKSRVKNFAIEGKTRAQEVVRKDLFFEGQDNFFYYVGKYDSETEIGENVVVQKIVEGRIVESLEAEKMLWTNRGWWFENAKRRLFSDLLLETSPERYEEHATLPYPALKETPEELAKEQKKPDEMGFFELERLIKIKKGLGEDTARELVELYLKITFPFVNFIVVFLGAPIAATPRRAGFMLGFAISLVISFLFYGLIRAGQSLGQNHKLPPLLAASFADIIFGLVGLVLLIKTKK
jgi:lipopolysaccharide export system permease protein